MVLNSTTRTRSKDNSSLPWGALNGVTPSYTEVGRIEALIDEATSAIDGTESKGMSLSPAPTAEGGRRSRSKDDLLERLSEAKRAVSTSQAQVLAILSDCMETVRGFSEVEAQALKDESECRGIEPSTTPQRKVQVQAVGEDSDAEPGATPSMCWASRRRSLTEEIASPRKADRRSSINRVLPLPRRVTVCEAEPVPVLKPSNTLALALEDHWDKARPTPKALGGRPMSSPGDLEHSETLGLRGDSAGDGPARRRGPRRHTQFTVRRQSVMSVSSAMFADADKMKAKIRQAVAKPVYNVTDYYKETGFFQKLARTQWFEQLTLVIIGLNAVWIGIDTDYNEHLVLSGAHPIFIVMENLFCLFFAMEWSVRFMAFTATRHALRDPWFMFDTCLVIITIIETWVITLVLAILLATTDFEIQAVLDSNASLLRLIRLLRISRISRMARVFNAIPELMIVMKGLAAGIRSVGVTLGMLTLIIYIFGLAFTSVAEGTPLRKRYFSGVAHSMGTLLLHGVFLEDIPEVWHACGNEHFMFSVVLLIFVLIASFLVVNMLVGVMVETVRVVSVVEREQLSVAAVKDKLQHMLQTTNLDQDGDNVISKDELGMLLQIPEAVRALQQMDVDAVALVDLASYVFEESSELHFPAFMDMVLQLRGTNKATVKDVVDLRKCMRQEIHKLSRMMEQILQGMAAANDGTASSTGGDVIFNSTNTNGEQSIPVSQLSKPGRQDNGD